ncbi:MAG: dienelactone hydrolase [Pseudorhodobacter sp.]|jgi:dienelactone hydrolase
MSTQPHARAFLIAHAFGGLAEFEKTQAVRLALEGYGVLALDYYGDGRRAADNAKLSAMMGV